MIFTIFKSVSKAYVEDMRDVFENVEWLDFVQILLDKQNVQEKEHGTLYTLSRFKNIGDPTAQLGRKKIYKNHEWTGEYHYYPNTVRRCKDNLVAISGMLLDFDKNVKIEDVMERYKNIEYVLYTTFNHTYDSHRFRVVIPFTTPLLVEDIERKKQFIEKTFVGVDPASFSASQSFYFHAGHNDPIAYHNVGYIIDPYNDFVDGIVEDKKIVKEHVNIFELSPEYQNKILNSLLSCRGLRYPNSLTLVAICKSYGLTFDNFNNICQQISDNDSTLIKTPSCRKDLWNSDYERITATKRDKFIKDHNGISVVTKREDKLIEYNQTRENMKIIEKYLKERKDARIKHQ